LPAAVPMQSSGTRIACIKVHRLCKDASPKRTAVVAECSPRTKHNTRSCESNNVAETCASETDVSVKCAFREFHHAQSDDQVPQNVGESQQVNVKVATTSPGKWCRDAKLQKTCSPVAADLCTVALSRLVIPENDLSQAVKNESEVNAAAAALAGVPSPTKVNMFVSASITDNDTAINGDADTESSLMSIVYPSCAQNVFLGNFGLANKAELPRNATGNRLHREIGGKLRRTIRPNAAMLRMYERTNSMRCVSFDSSSDTSHVHLSSRSLHTSRESSPRSLHTRDLSSVSMKKLSSALSKRLRPSNIDKSIDSNSSAETCKMEPSASTDDDSQEQIRSSLSILADMALAHLDASKSPDAKQITPAKDEMKKSSSKSKVTFDTVIFY